MSRSCDARCVFQLRVPDFTSVTYVILMSSYQALFLWSDQEEGPVSDKSDHVTNYMGHESIDEKRLNNVQIYLLLLASL